MDQFVPVTSVQVLTASAACAIVEQVMRHAAHNGFAASAAVVDPSGLLMAFARSDGARIATIDLAIDKAWTAMSLGLPTHFWAERIDHPKVAALASRPRFVALAGGFPLVAEGTTVGAIGVSGGSDEQDIAAASEAMTAAGFAPAL